MHKILSKNFVESTFSEIVMAAANPVDVALCDATSMLETTCSAWTQAVLSFRPLAASTSGVRQRTFSENP